MNNTKTPDTLVDRHGRVTLGLFPQTVTKINGRQADYRTPLGKPASRRARHLHYKQFQYFGIICNDLLAGCALADTAYVGMAFFYIFEPRSGSLREYTWRSPLAAGLRLSTSPLQGKSRFRQRKVDIEMGYETTPEGPVKTLNVDIPGLRLQARMEEGAAYQPMSLCTRAGINGWVYANKVAGRTVTGFLEDNGKRQDLSAVQACGHHDFSAGYMRRETFWNWACLSAIVDNHEIGVNLSCGVNETSVSENCLWVDGQRIPTGGVSFHYDRDDLMKAWSIISQCGRIRLTFQPLGNHREKLDLGLFASNFNQLFGHFDGQIVLPDGRHIDVKNLYGFVEEQYAKW